MITYKVKFREMGADHWFEIENVIEDSCYIEMIETPRGMQPMSSYPVRSFLTKSKDRVEVPMLTHVFEYGPEREQVVADRIKQLKERAECEERKRKKKDYHRPPNPGLDWGE